MLPKPIAQATQSLPKHSRSYLDYLASRPVAAETEAIDRVLELSAQHNCAVHIVHLSSGRGAQQVAQARQQGLSVTAECCPHYLTFASEQIPSGATHFKCAPPIRDAENREQLWEALAAGSIDFIASDHSPCPPHMKHSDSGDFFAAWGGIASLGLTLAVVWTEAKARGYDFSTLHRWLSAGPAQLAQLSHRKGQIAVGYDADLVVWRPEERFVVEPRHLHFRHPVSPYLGLELHGVVETTYLRGAPIFTTQTSQAIGATPSGRWLPRERP